MPFWTIVLCLALACGSGKDDRPAPAGSDAAPGQASGSGAPSGMGNLGMMSSLLSSSAGQPGPYDEPLESDGFDDSADHAAVIELGGEVSELGVLSLLGGRAGTELRQIQDKLRELAGDAKVTALVIRFEPLDISPALAEELRASLIAFKTAGKQPRAVHCHTESAANFTYVVMTACDAIALAPLGDIAINGVALAPIHLKRLLDKVGVVGDFLHVGAFKGAAEPLTMTAPSKETVQTLQAILDEAFDTLVQAVVDGRKLDRDKVVALIDGGLYTDDAALAAGLIDQVATFDAFRDKQLGKTPWRRLKIHDDAPPDMAELMELIGLTRKPRPTGAHVALVYAVGSVVDGKGEGAVGARTQIASRPLSAALRVLAADDSVKAIVVRISSGGGSALSSELIWHAMREAKAHKPVIVSMGGMAASGGYYIASGGTKIYALRNTLTGSIGVVGGKVVLGRALDKLGVDAYPMGRGKRSKMWAVFAPWTADERAQVQATMEAVYSRFLARVAESRGRPREEIDKVAQGRVWTGDDARERGLVDELGGLEQALAEARKLGDVGVDEPLEVYPPEPTLLDLVGALGVSAPAGVDAVLVEVRHALGDRAARAVAAAIHDVQSFRSVPIQTVAIWPVVLL